MNKERMKDIAVRAAKTFVQAFIGAISVDVVLATPDRSVWRSALLGGLAAGISALWNFTLNLMDENKLN